MRQRRCGVQTHQEVADRRQRFVQRLDLAGQCFVGRHQRRQCCAKEQDGLSRRAEREPAEDRHRDEERIERDVP